MSLILSAGLQTQIYPSWRSPEELNDYPRNPRITDQITLTTLRQLLE